MGDTFFQTSPHRMRTSIVAVISLTVLAVGIAWYSFFLNDFAVTPDMSGLACAAEALAKTGEFSTIVIQPLGYEICWQKTTYPLLQVVHSLLLHIVPIAGWQLVMLTGSIAFVLCVVGIFGITFQISRSLTAGFVAGLCAAFSPALLRSQVLTPQNLFGYVLLLLAIWLAILAVQKNRWWILFTELPLLGVLGLTHDLSFGIAAVVLTTWFVLVYLKQWWLKSGIVVGGGLLLAVDYYKTVLPDVLHNKIYFILHNNFPGIYHPLWDHPAIWGYIITSLAAFGLVFLFARNTVVTNQKIRWLVVILLLVPVLFGQLPIFGIRLLPNRFVPFAWIGLSILAGIAVVEMQKYLRIKKILYTVLMVLLLGAQGVHGVIFMKDDIEGWSARYRPEPDFVEALQWLDAHHPNGELLGVQSAINQQILLAPLWYHGSITYYPWYALNHRDIKKFTASPSTPYHGLLEHPEDPSYVWLHNLYTIMTQPESTEAKTALTAVDVQYLIEWKRSLEYTQIWKDVRDYPVIYKNTSYVIYKLQ